MTPAEFSELVRRVEQWQDSAAQEAAAGSEYHQGAADAYSTVLSAIHGKVQRVPADDPFAWPGEPVAF